MLLIGSQAYGTVPLLNAIRASRYATISRNPPGRIYSISLGLRAEMAWFLGGLVACTFDFQNV